MSDTQEQSRTIKLYKFRDMFGYLQPAGDRMFFIEIENMEEAIDVTDVSTDQLEDTGKTGTLTWWDPL